jgi:hypothetical protein
MSDAEPYVKKCRLYLKGCRKAPCDDEILQEGCEALVACYDNGSQCQDTAIGVFDTLIPPFVIECLVDVKSCA